MVCMQCRWRGSHVESPRPGSTIKHFAGPIPQVTMVLQAEMGGDGSEVKSSQDVFVSMPCLPISTSRSFNGCLAPFSRRQIGIPPKP